MTEPLALATEAPARPGILAAVGLRDRLAPIFYYKWVVLLAFLVPAALGVAAGFMARTSYVAQAKLLVLYGSDYVFHPGNRDTGNDITLDRNQVIQGELQILASPALAAEVLQEIGPHSVYPGLPPDDTALPSAVSRFLTDLVITSVPQSNVLELGLRNADRAVAIRVLNQLITRYLTFRAAIFDRSQPQAVNAQRELFAARLQSSEEELARFGSEHGISNLEEQISLQLKQQADINTAMSATAQAIGELSARVASLHAQLATLSPTTQVFAESAPSQRSIALKDNLLKLEVQRRGLSSRYQDDFPLVQSIDRQIAELKSELGGDPAREANVARLGRNSIYDDLHREEIAGAAELLGLQAKLAEQQAEAARIQARMEELTGLSRHYRDLQRNRDVLDHSYSAIARSSEETQLSRALEQAAGANVRVVQPADAPLTGRSQRNVLFAGGVVLGVLCAAALVALLNAIRQVFISVYDVEQQLGLPVLLAVPLIKPRRRRFALKSQARQAVEQPSYGL